MTVRETARQAAAVAYNQIGPLGPNVIADAVAVALLQELFADIPGTGAATRKGSRCESVTAASVTSA